MKLIRQLWEDSESVVTPLKNIMFRKGYPFYTKPFDVNIIGIRMKDQDFKKFADLFLLVYTDHLNYNHVEKAIGTTVPGIIYHSNYSNPEGLGIIVPGHYKAVWEKGKHKGREALTQCGNFNVYRDKNKDGKIDKNVVVVAGPDKRFDLHDAHSSTFPDKIFLENIGGFSEGCQVLANKVKYRMWYEIISYSMKLLKYFKVSYTLLEEDDFITM